jgi:hypothetical protein
VGDIDQLEVDIEFGMGELNLDDKHETQIKSAEISFITLSGLHPEIEYEERSKSRGSFNPDRSRR